MVDAYRFRGAMAAGSIMAGAHTGPHEASVVIPRSASNSVFIEHNTMTTCFKMKLLFNSLFKYFWWNIPC